MLERLKAKTVPSTLCLETANQPARGTPVGVTSLTVSAPDDGPAVELQKVYSLSSLPTRIRFATRRDVAAHCHLRKLPLPDDNKAPNQVEMLIGIDAHRALKPTALALGRPDEPYAMKTCLGWAVVGPIQDEASCFAVDAEEIDPLMTRLDRFWALESAGLFENVKAPSVNDKKVAKLWEDEVIMVNGHFQLPIPFKGSGPALPDNFPSALQRLRQLKRRLLRDDRLKQQYAEGMADLLKKGYAEPAPERESSQPDVWYIPHHPVFNPAKEKLRIVYDCAAQAHGQSLNAAVHSGPDLTNALVGVLLRFRQREVAIMADIKAMFHQVKVPPSQRDSLRFLWFPDGDVEREPQAYRMTSHLFGGTWSPAACLHALQHTATTFGGNYSELTVNTVCRHFYVDDLLKSTASEHEAKLLAKELPKLLKKGGFHLTKWTSNRRSVLEDVPEAELSKNVKGGLPGAPLEETALGVYWNATEDDLRFQARLPGHQLTRRGLLSALSSVFDPLGLISPFLVSARKIVQDACRKKLHWDETVPQDLRESMTCRWDVQSSG